MPWTDKDWKDDPDATTPLSAAGMEDLEARIKASLCQLTQIVKFEASGAFVKANYPGLVRVRVRMVGGGGGGAGTDATTASQVASGSGGGGGAYAEKIIAAASLAASETVTIGTAGSGTNNAETAGGDTSFGTLVIAKGGAPGSGGTAESSNHMENGGAGGDGTTSTGDLCFTGGPGGHAAGIGVTPYIVWPGQGGASAFGGGTRCSATDNGQAGLSPNAKAYGAGGGGAFARNSQAAFNGGNGMTGLVIVEIYTT